MSAMLEYQDLKSPIHKLTGATKLIALIFWALASMITYDTRILGGMFILSIIMFKVSKVKFKDISFVLYLILIFLLINNIAIFLFACIDYCHFMLFTLFNTINTFTLFVYHQFLICLHISHMLLIVS